MRKQTGNTRDFSAIETISVNRETIESKSISLVTNNGLNPLDIMMTKPFSNEQKELQKDKNLLSDIQKVHRDEQLYFGEPNVKSFQNQILFNTVTPIAREELAHLQQLVRDLVQGDAKFKFVINLTVFRLQAGHQKLTVLTKHHV